MALKETYALWADLLTSPETYVALTPSAVLDWCDKQSFLQSCYFLCLCDTTPCTTLETCGTSFFSLGLCELKYPLFCKLAPCVSETKHCQKNNQIMVNFIIVNSMKDPVAKFHSVTGITWL
jgi:hypothetical protein